MVSNLFLPPYLVTPEDYEPPGFQPTSSENFEFEESAVNIRIGEVATPFHSYVNTSSPNYSIVSPSEIRTTSVQRTTEIGLSIV